MTELDKGLVVLGALSDPAFDDTTTLPDASKERETNIEVGAAFSSRLCTSVERAVNYLIFQYWRSSVQPSHVSRMLFGSRHMKPAASLSN